jgi:multidrug efflux pump subunit AcrA (membrane-fusion protein)
MMKRIISWFRRVGSVIHTGGTRSWKWFKGRKRWQQIAMIVAAIAVLGGIAFAIANSGAATADDTQTRTVTLQSIGSLTGGGDSVSIIGSVRSVAQADLLAQAGGTVEAVHAQIGSSVPAGFVIAELDNATERAQVLQAQGAYDAAIASRNAVSPSDATATVRNTYRSVFAALDTTLHTQIDQFFGNQTAVGPQFLLNQGSTPVEKISRDRAAIDQTMIARRSTLSQTDTRDPGTLLNESESDLSAVGSLLDEIAVAAGRRDSRVTPDQTAALAAARATINAELAAIAGAREAYRAKSTTSSASVDAGVKSALGALRLTQAGLEKTFVRAPIGGTVNFLPIHIGDYVTAFEHVATVAQNGALEIVSYVSENARQNITAGMKVRIDDKYDGIITTIAPALDPTTKQTEVHVAVSGTTDLVNGQSVRIAFPDAAAPKPAQTVASATSTGPLLLPLTALKLTPSARVIFTVGTDNRLVAHEVTIGDVRGDRIEVTTQLPSDLQIVTDARGLSEGEQVKVGTNATP